MMVSIFANLLLLIAMAQSPGLEIKRGWIREAPPGAAVMAGYVEIVNPGNTLVTIDSASSEDFAEVEFHEMSMDAGIMRMRGIGELAIPAGQSLRLAPGATHLMLHQPRRALKAGDKVTIEFAPLKGDALRATFEVRRAP